MTGMTEKTVEHFVLGAGVFAKDFIPGTDTYESAKTAGKLLGATTGGGEFKAAKVGHYSQVDGAPENTKLFFYLCSQTRAKYVIDLIARRYPNRDFMQGWDFGEAVDFIIYAIERTAEEQIEMRWVLHYQDRMTLQEFKNALSSAQTQNTERPEPMIEADVEKILNMRLEV